MNRATTLACILAVTTAAAGPAAADSLTGLTGFLTTDATDSSAGQGRAHLHNWDIGGALAGPLGLPNLNFQAGAQYDPSWASHYANTNIGISGSAFWADADGRLGVTGGYDTVRHLGDLGYFGGIGEWYFGPLTAMAKAGYLNAGGSGTLWSAGRGAYFGGALSGYLMPDLALTGFVTNNDLTTGRGCLICGRGDISSTPYGVEVEYLFAEPYGVSGFVNLTANRLDFVEHEPGGFQHQGIAWMVGLRWYPGTGTLIDHQRNGTLNPWLAGTGEPLPALAYGSFLRNGQ